MKKILLLFVLASHFCLAQTHDLSYYLAEARKAYTAKDYQQLYAMTLEANKLNPYHQGILYQLGRACALLNKPAEAIPYLRKAILVDARYKLDHADLASLGALPEFTALVDLQKSLQTPIVNSDTAVLIKDRTLHAESVAYDETSKSFFVGSIHKRKIIKVGSGGTPVDFTTNGQYGLTAVFGLKVDVSKNLLWACASAMEEMENYDSTAQSGVYKFDLKSGKLLSSYHPEDKKSNHIFGDLTLNSKGEAFVSDTRYNIVFKVDEAASKLTTYCSSPEFRNLQGITFSPNDQYLFISDYIAGPYRLDLKTNKVTKIETDKEVSLKGIDGLTFYKNSLIAIQNGTNPLRVTRYMLNKSMDRIVDFEIIDRAHPAFNEPTIGSLVGDTFYFIANSQWGGYDDKHNLKPVEQLQDIVILHASFATKAQRH